MSSIRKLEAMKLDQDEEEKAERRIENERRQFSYSAHIPERRTGHRRRKQTEPCDTPHDARDQDSRE
jgi:hypothetical protein